MNHFKLSACLFIIVVISCRQIDPDSAMQASQENAPVNDTIPFSLTLHNNIVVSCVINDTDSLNLMFHSDAHYVSLTTEALQKTKSISFQDTSDVKSWGGGGEATSSQNNMLSVGHSQYDSLTIWSTQRSGHFTDGKFGPTVLETELFEINYSDNIIVLHHHKPTVEHLENYQSITLDNRDGSLFIKGSSIINTDTFNQQFLLHTGYSGTILFDDEFTSTHRLGTELTIIDEGELSDSYGNKITTKKALLPTFLIGNNAFNNVPVGFFEGSVGRQKMSVIGCELIKRFDHIFDIESETLYLKPSQYTDLPFPDK